MRPPSASRSLPCPRRRAGRSGLLAAAGLFLAGLVALAGPVSGAGASVPSAPAGGVRLARIGLAPRVPAGATAIGAVAPATPVQVTVALMPHDPAGLAAYAQAVATPGSGAYHRYLSVAEFAQRFGADPAEVDAVQAALRTQGLSPSGPSANHLELSVTAPAGIAATAFATRLERLRLADGGGAVTSLTAPAVPADVAGLVQGVVGLSSLTTPAPSALLRRPARRLPAVFRRDTLSARAADGRTLAATSVPGEGPACLAAANSGAYTAGQIASAYGFSGLYAAGDGGAGQTIALFELEPYSATDIAAYQRCYGTATSVTPVPVDGGAGSGTGSGEAALDIEDLIGLAPRASILVYEGPNSGAGAYDTYARMISDDRAKVISTSWGACEDPSYASQLQAEATLFEEAAAQGQTVLAASGDSGADDCGTGAGPAVDDPASQPDVTGVGGTTLTSGTSGPRETVWNSTWSGGAGAGGGGVSSIWPRPSYQAGSALGQAATTCGASQTACREVPDVSADADVNTGYAIYFSGGWYDFGGTSAATPTWAALVALADAWSGCSAPLGLLNPGLYQAARSSQSSPLNDITAGNNTFDGVTGYPAAAGYDMASGLGSPQGSALAAALCAGAAPGGGGTVAAAPAGGSAGSDTTGTGSTGAGTTGTGTSTGPGTTGSGATGSGSTTPTAPGQVTAPAASPVASVAVAVAPNADGLVGRPFTLAARGVDTAARPLSWRADNLPAGLSVDPGTGTISGVPVQAADTLVTLRATDPAGATGQATVHLVIAGAPVVTGQITFPHRGRVQIGVLAQAGEFSGGIRRLVLALHGRLVRLPAASRLGRLITLRGAGGRRLAVRARRRGDLVIVTLDAPVARLALRLVAPAASSPARLAASAAGARRPAALVTVTVA